MKDLILLYIVLAAMVSVVPVGAAFGQPPSRVIGYFPGWRDASAADLPGELLTHVCYAFALIKDGQCAIDKPEPFNRHLPELRQLKQKHPHIRTFISIGGWTGSAPFSDMALTEASRDTFARSCADFVSLHGFDGVDVDWEYPVGGGNDPSKGRPEDKRNFTLLLAQLRRHLDEQGKIDNKRYLLTAATPAPRRHYEDMELDQIHQHLDWINLMTYDMAGAWSKLTSFNAPLYGEPLSADASVRGYLAAGVPRDKLVLGVPFYGKAFGGVKDIDDGLHQPHDGKPPSARGSGGWSYRNIAQTYADKSAKRFWHDQAKVPWLFDKSTGLMVTYDDPQSLQLKAEYARDNKLGGVMMWELTQDDEASSLLRALNAGLRGRD
jgi:chitinase